jgi:hypothetical protein
VDDPTRVRASPEHFRVLDVSLARIRRATPPRSSFDSPAFVVRLPPRSSFDAPRSPRGERGATTRACVGPTVRRVDRELLTTEEARKLLRYASRRGLLKAVERGEIVPFGRRGRTYVFDRASILATLSARAREVPIRPEAMGHAQNREVRKADRARRLATEDERIPASNPAEGSDDREEAQRASAAGRCVAKRSVGRARAPHGRADLERRVDDGSDVLDDDDVLGDDLVDEDGDAIEDGGDAERGLVSTRDSLRPAGVGARARAERADVGAGDGALERVPERTDYGRFDDYDEPSDASYFRDLLARKEGGAR